MSQSLARAGSSPDLSPEAIGGLFRRAHAKHIEKVRLLIECGHLLKAKKDSLEFREWLPWLEANQESLGFGERAAQLMMKAASNPNPQLTSDLTPADALWINRGIWGNSPKKTTAQISHQPAATPEPPLEASPDVPADAAPPPIIGDSTEPGYEPWTEADQRAEMERMDREHEVFLEYLKTADDQRSALYTEVKRLEGMLAIVSTARNGYQNQAGAAARMVKTEQNRNDRLQSRITELERQIIDRDSVIKKLKSDNDALRERIAIMEES